MQFVESLTPDEIGDRDASSSVRGGVSCDSRSRLLRLVFRRSLHVSLRMQLLWDPWESVLPASVSEIWVSGRLRSGLSSQVLKPQV